MLLFLTVVPQPLIEIASQPLLFCAVLLMKQFSITLFDFVRLSTLPPVMSIAPIPILKKLQPEISTLYEPSSC